MSVCIVEICARLCSAMASWCIRLVSVAENQAAATLSLFSDFLLRLCEAGLVLQPREGEH